MRDIRWIGAVVERTVLAGLGLLGADAVLTLLGQLKFRWVRPASVRVGSVIAPHRPAPTLEYRPFFVRLPQGAERGR